jgi:ribosomal protein S6
MTDKNSNDLDIKEPKFYEVGYLLVPFFGETEKADMVQKEIKAVIEAVGAKPGSEVAPVMKNLAYPIRKMLNNKYDLFRQAYFGAVRFEADPATVPVISKNFQKSEAIIRFLLIEMPKPTPLKKKKTTTLVADEAPVVVPPSIETDEQAIDKEIDELLVTS